MPLVRLVALACVVSLLGCALDEDPVSIGFQVGVDAGESDDAAADEDSRPGDRDAEPDPESDAEDPVPEVDPPVEDTTEPDAGPAAPPEVCFAYCDKLAECGQPYGKTEACPTDCADQIAQNPDWENSYLCALFAQCPNLQFCTNAPIPTTPACVEMCGTAAECDIFPSSALGAATEEGCVAGCSVQMAFQAATYTPVLQCLQAAMNECSETQALSCSPNLAENLCAGICEGGWQPNNQQATCGVLPSGFDSAAACQQVCAGYSDAQRWKARFCLNAFQCNPDGMDACFPPPAEPLPGSFDTCEAAWALCGGIDGFTFPKDTEFCSWIIDGLVYAEENLSTENAAACIEGFGTCPDTPNAIVGCLAETYDGCQGYCERLVECGSPTTVAACVPQCSYGYATNPETTQETIDCVEAAPVCALIAQCFEGAGGGQ